MKLGAMSQLRQLVDLICLVYHEARNVRHPIKIGAITDKTRYLKLTNLPSNKEQAWHQMTKVRDNAVNADGAEGAASVFKKEYGVSLDDLLHLYKQSFWKGSAYGGNQWAQICKSVLQLIKAMTDGDSCRSELLLKDIPKMSHNTGTVVAKLSDLKSFRG